jgi:3-oxoacyl-[acyl-carrier protein] reductase
MNDLSGRVAIVTGGSGGIGGAIMDSLAGAGAEVVNFDRIEQQTNSSGRPVWWIPCDVRDDQSVGRAVMAALERHGRIDFAIHAAGVSRDGVVWKLPIEEWDLVHAVNLRGAFLLMRHVVPAMRGTGGGRIVLIGSINGSRGKFGTSAYSASKAGLIGLAKSVSREAGSLGILVNVVEPGWVRTALTETYPEEVRQKALAETQLGELVDPCDVAATVLFLCGPGSRRMTGQVLRVDAGQYL